MKLFFSKYIILAGLFVWSCNSKNKDINQAPIEVKAMKIQMLDTVVQVRYVADIHAQTFVEIRARQGGMLERILVDEGQMVQTGQPLFKLTAIELEAQVSSAKAAVLLAQAELKKAQLERHRVANLVEKNVVTATELDLAEAEEQIAQARLEDAKAMQKTAESQLSYTTIKAPFSGRINRFALKVGAMVQPGELISTMSDNSSIFAYFNISEKDYLKNRKNINAGEGAIPKTVSLLLADGSEYLRPGYIEATESEFDANTGAIALRARFPNPDGLLKHRSTGQVRIELEQNDVFLIPQKAVQELQDRYFLYVIDDKQILQIRIVKPTSRIGNFYVVSEGLKNGELIVKEGIQNLREGILIRPLLDTVNSISNKAN